VPFTNSGSFALRKLRRDLQGKGVNFRKTTDITGAAPNTPIVVPGLGVSDELVSVLLLISGVFPTQYRELLSMTPAVAVQASVLDSGGASRLKFIAQSAYPGSKGNGITVAYVTGATTINVVVTGTAITVNFVSGNTVNDVLNILKITPAAMALVDVDLAQGTGADTVVVMIPAQGTLAGGVDADVPNVTIVETPAVQATLIPAGQAAQSQLKFIAQSVYPGTKGNAITVNYVVAAGNNPLTIVVSGTAITVNMATAAGVDTSIATDVLAALKINSAAMALVDVDIPSGDGSGLFVSSGGAMALTGGLDPAAAIQTPTVTNTNALDRLIVEFLSRT